MKNSKGIGRKISTALLALLLCVALMPVGVFADDEGAAPVDEAQAEEFVTEDSSEAAPDAVENTDAEDVTLNAADEPAECAHASLKRIPAVKAKCNKEGVKEHYQCTECGQRFLDNSASQPVDESDVVIAIDPQAHEWGDWEKTKEATPTEQGELTRTCKLCGETEVKPFDYVEPIPVKQAKSFTLDGIKVKFKTKVSTEPIENKNIIPGRVWVKGQKTSMKVAWKNPSDLNAIDGVIILRADGSSKVFTEVKRIQFKTFKNGEPVIKAKTAFTDKAAKKKNTAYTYRVISYFEEDDIIYLSHISKNDWAAGQTSASKLKNVYKATINKKSAKLQSGGKVTLKLTVASPKTKFKPSSVRWSSSNKNVAAVSSKGKVTARAPGTATIRGRLASGYEISSKITVKGAYKPGKPTIKVDFATTSSITLMWNKVKYATSYDVYKSDDGLHWDKTPRNTKKTTIKIDGLKKGQRYTFYVIARNDHKGLDKNGKSKTYTALGDNSNVLNQKAVVKRRPMTLTGFPAKKTQKTGTTLNVTIKINPPLGRKAELQMKSGNKWVTKQIVKLPKGASKASATITFPNDWWDATTEWRLVVPPSTTTSGVTTDTLKITATRNYQNPSAYVQIKNSISKHGYSHYVSPVLVNGSSTKSNHIEALLKTARKYLGDRYVQSQSGAPGKGIDESGLVIQACYGAGVDLWPISPSTRPYNCVPSIMNSKLKSIKYTQGSNDFSNMTRGDLVFFATSKNGTAIHVGIYDGQVGVIHADPIKGVVNKSSIKSLENKDGAYKYYVVGVRRIFN